MKIAVSGKGGVGKSTISALFCHLAVAEGMRVLAIDADPAASLAAGLGIGAEQRKAIVPLAERRALIEARTGAKVKQYGQIFKLNPEVADIAEQESIHHRGVHLLVLGAIERGGSGCACPESVILRELVADAVLHKDDCVILDMEAGLEHLGRGTTRGVDLLVVVAEPSRCSVEIADSVRRFAGEIGIKRLVAIGNKLVSDEDDAFLRRELTSIDYLGGLPLEAGVRQADRDGRAAFDVVTPAWLTQVRALWERVKARAQV